MKIRYAELVLALAVAGNSLFAVQERRLDQTDRLALYVMDCWIGVWHLNVAKSQFHPGPPLKSGKAQIDLYGEGVKCAWDSVSADGKALRAVWTAQYDGKDYPVAKDPNADSIMLNKTDSHTLQVVHKREGKEILSEKWVVSRDRRELTITRTERDFSGKTHMSVLVYRKQ